MLIGKSDKIIVIDAYLDQKTVDAHLGKIFQNIPETEQVIMLSDLYGGSVNREMYMYLERPNTFLVAGVNLALILEIALRTEPLDRETLEAIVKESREALRIVEIESSKGGDNGDFLEETK